MSEARRVLPWVWTGLIGTAGVSVLVVGYIPRGGTDVVSAVISVVFLILIAALGSVISARQPGNRIALLLHATSVGLLLLVASSLVAESDQPPISPDFWDYIAVVIFNTLAESILYPVFLILFIFPTGRFLTQRWAWAGWVGAVLVPAMLLVALFSEEVGKIYDPLDEHWGLPNPIGFLPSGVGEFMASAWVTALMVLAVGGVVAMVVRYRRSDSVVRTQIKWVLYAAAISAVAWLALLLSRTTNTTAYQLVGLTVIGIIAVAITIAITRYKLFEIDRIINRTVVYGAVVAMLAGVYASAVFGLRGLLPDGSDLAVAASTLAVAVLFNPVRIRVQRFVDRRFYRSRYDAQRIIEGFSAHIGSEVDLDQLTDKWVETVTHALKPATAAVWIRSRT